MDSKESRKTYAILRKVRSTFVAVFGLILPTSYFPVATTKQFYDGPLKQTCFPGLNCHACPTALTACPIGILQHFSAIGKIPFFLLGVLGAIGMAFARAVCGWVCPLGWIQDQLFRIKTRKMGIPTFLKQGKYVSLVVLALILPYSPKRTGFQEFVRGDPQCRDSLDHLESDQPDIRRACHRASDGRMDAYHENPHSGVFPCALCSHKPAILSDALSAWRLLFTVQPRELREDGC